MYSAEKELFMMCFSPLEQFTLISLIPLHFGNFYFSFTNSSLFMLLATGIFLALFSLVTVNGGTLVPGPWQSFLEMSYEFVQGIMSTLSNSISKYNAARSSKYPNCLMSSRIVPK